MTTVTSSDLMAIVQVAAWESAVLIRDRNLTPPIGLLVTGGDDELLVEAEVSIDGTGKPNITIRSSGSTEIPFPIIYTLSDCEGRRVEGVFSEEVVRKLQRAS